MDTDVIISADNIQSIPVTDSPNNDAFEAIVEAYYQAQGYITSAGKWFWVWDKENGKSKGDIKILMYWRSMGIKQ
jgi:hypothetical protein